MKGIKDNEATYHKVYENGRKEFFIKQHYLDSDKGFGFSTTYWDEVSGLAFTKIFRKNKFRNSHLD